MKLNKKWWLIIGFSTVALIGIALVVVLVVLNNQDPPEPEKNKYTISITINNSEFGIVSGLNSDGVYVEGENIELGFTPYESKCIESIYVNGVNVCDYIVDETINIQNEYRYTIENISENIEIVVTFDEAKTIEDLNYITMQKSGVTDEQYGNLRIWGSSTVYPKNGRVRLQIAPSGRYDFISYILPDDRSNNRLSTQDYSFVDKSDETRTMQYDSATQSFIMSKAYVKLEEKQGFKLELVFAPTTIELLIYESKDGETFTLDSSFEEQLYTSYTINSSQENDYTWYYCITNNVIYPNLLKANIKEKTVSGTTYKYIELSHELYADNIDSKKIILVRVKNK